MIYLRVALLAAASLIIPVTSGENGQEEHHFCRSTHEGCNYRHTCCPGNYCNNGLAIDGFCERTESPYGHSPKPTSKATTKKPASFSSTGSSCNGKGCARPNREGRSDFFDELGHGLEQTFGNAGKQMDSAFNGGNGNQPAGSGRPSNNPVTSHNDRPTPKPCKRDGPVCLSTPPGMSHPEPIVWPIDSSKRIHYKFHLFNNHPNNTRFVNAAHRAIAMINDAMRGCWTMVETSANQFPLLTINLFVDECATKSCDAGGGAPCSERLGYSDTGDNSISVNTLPYDQQGHPDSLLVAVFLHELLHAIFDFRHEHIRGDRDSYIRLVPQYEICPGVHTYFEMASPEDGGYFPSDQYYYPYDRQSIMHAGFDDYAFPNTYTLALWDGTPSQFIGPSKTNPKLTYTDTVKMRDRYRCPPVNGTPPRGRRSAEITDL